MGAEAGGNPAASRGSLSRFYFKYRGWPVLIANAVWPFCFWNELESVAWCWGVGLSLIAAGGALRLWGIAHLGWRNARSHRVKTRVMVTTGPYAYLRNPLYAANILVSLGLCALAELFWYLPILGGVLLIHYTIVSMIEEGRLREAFGDAYEAYRRRVSRWIPRLGRRTGAEPSRDASGQEEKAPLPQLLWGEIMGIAGVAGGILFAVVKEWVEHWLW
jgi:protein-S-isoprenylcysteine O-methyltransferase Ste14